MTDKGGDLGNRDSDVVFDAGAELALGGGNVFTQRPQIEALLFGLRDDAVFLAVLIEKLGKFFVERGIGNRVGQFEQDVPVCIGRLFEMTELGRQCQGVAADQLETGEAFGKMPLYGR